MAERCDRFQSVLLTILLAAGAGAIWGVVVLWIYILIVKGLLPIDIDYGRREHREIIVRDGMPFIRSQPSRSYYSGQRADFSYHTIDRQPFKDEAGQAESSPQSLPGPGYLEEPFRSLDWSHRILPLVDRSELWFFVHDGNLDGRAYFVGYDPDTKQKIGYLGRAGLCRDEPSPDEQFRVDGRRPVGYGHSAIHYLTSTDAAEDQRHADANDRSGSATLYLHADDGLFRVSARDRTVKLFWSGGDLISVAPGSIIEPAKKDSPRKWILRDRILLRTSERIILVDDNGQEVESFPIPKEFRDVGFSWFPLPDGAALIQRETSHDVDELCWLNAAGEVVRHEEVDLRETDSWLATYRRIAEMPIIPAVLPSPGTIAGIAVCYPWNATEGKAHWTTVRKVLHNLRWVFLITSIISIVLAVLCFRRQRAYGLPWTPVWTLLVLVFGLPAYFGYLAHRTWPGRAACPHCGRLAPRDRPACFACGREFPTPALKGTEVFA